MANTSMIRADHAQTADRVEQFHRDGFLFLRNVLDEARTEHIYRNADERLRVLLGFLPGGAYG